MAKLLVQIPALNEAATLRLVLDGLPKELPGVSEVGVVVVDDGSSDQTAQIASDWGAYVVRHESTRGVGEAFRSGLRKSLELGADVVVTMDADGQFNGSDIEKLVAPIIRDEADFVSASRFKDPTMTPKMPYAKSWGNRVIARWLSRMTGRTFFDVSCGMRAYNRQAALRLNPQGRFTYTHEVFLSLAFSGLRIQEVPVRVESREHGDSRVASNLFRYGWRAASIIFATYRDYRPLAFFGTIAAAFGIVGLAAWIFLFAHWLMTGAFTPYKYVGFAGGLFCGSALLVYLIGLLAAMLVRIRSGIDALSVRIGSAEQKLQKPTSMD
jgi:glycosyltransferase involved in cell wall biosynthesis